MILNKSIFARLNLFLTNLTPSLKQRPEDIRLFVANEVDENLIQSLKEVNAQLKIENSFPIVNEKPDGSDFIEELVNAFLIELHNELKTTNAVADSKDVDVKLDGVFDQGKRYEIPISDSSFFNAYSWGDNSLPSIIIIMPLGMPIDIMRKWIEKLTKSNHVISWETRGVFLPSSQIKNLDLSIKSQLDDLEKIIRFFNVEKTHLFAICQGVNLALHALKRFDSIVVSASLWHGDYNWNNEEMRTYTQNNFKTMVSMFKNGIDIEGLRSIMCNPRVIESLKKEYEMEIIPLIMYPYSSNEVFHNYVTISELVIFGDLESLSKNIHQKVLIATSNEDSTAHPLGSEELHKRMPGSIYYCREEGSHISFFDAPNELSKLFYNFYEVN